ncbi:GNAT family N-acetyltransferase [Micromonospora sp. CA-263727]|uniref:GNAT family N-acetyltransferase n=1 Tax=Micromonospora sp. CA-263727 TaxID=3239967 RepID=UPI003D8DA815
MSSPPNTHAHPVALGQPRTRPRPYSHPDVQHLLHRLHAEQLAMYGHADPTDDTPASDYDPPTGLFLVIYLDQQSAACGGWRRIAAGHAEIKRMYVRPELRGHGLGRSILRHLESNAHAAGARHIQLETGRHNDRALRLYAAAGYEPTPPYVPGRDPAINRALHKNLAP